jgi:ABC-type dipeptide/oligopeptide/nickel transport system permease component
VVASDVGLGAGESAAETLDAAIIMAITIIAKNCFIFIAFIFEIFLENFDERNRVGRDRES